MKKVLLLSLSLIISVCAFGAFDVPHLTVYGKADTRVAPDELKWSLSVKTIGQDVGPLADEHIY